MLGVIGFDFPVSSTTRYAVDDTTKGLSAEDYQSNPDRGGYRDKAVAALITVETKPVRVSCDPNNPASRTGPKGHLVDVGGIIHLKNFSDIKNFTFTNATSGENAALVVSLSVVRT